MKKAYTAPELEAVRLTMRDVILSSPVVPEDEIGKEEETFFDPLFDANGGVG